MRGRKHYKSSLLLVAIAGLYGLAANANQITYCLTEGQTVREEHNSAGWTNVQSGQVYLGKTLVGHYKMHVDGVKSPVDKERRAKLEMTVVWYYGGYNFTVQGSHRTDGWQNLTLGTVSSGYGFGFTGATAVTSLGWNGCINLTIDY